MEKKFKKSCCDLELDRTMPKVELVRAISMTFLTIQPSLDSILSVSSCGTSDDVQETEIDTKKTEKGF